MQVLPMVGWLKLSVGLAKLLIVLFSIRFSLLIFEVAEAAAGEWEAAGSSAAATAVSLAALTAVLAVLWLVSVPP